MASSNIPTPPGQLPDTEDLYVRWIREYLGLRLGDAQEQIIRSIYNNRKTLVVGANGFGKTYAVTAAALAFLFTNYPSKVLATSGTYGKLRRTMCRPLEQLHKNAQTRYGIPGTYKHSPPRLEFDVDSEWFFEASRPRDAGELEGTHSPNLLSIVEEADKENVTRDVLDSMESLLTDENDRMVVIANPPHEKANIVADLMGDPSWHLLQFSSFESHNIGVDDGDRIPGLTTLTEIKENWESWNREPWPGTEAARRAANPTGIERDDLDARWYRRRAGVIPPSSATTFRPFTVEDVEQAWNPAAEYTDSWDGFGVDVARAGGDRTAIAGCNSRVIKILRDWSGTDHNTNEQHIRDVLDEYPGRTTAIDAQGEGSALADRLTQAYPEAKRFSAGAEAVDGEEYRDCWTEGVSLLGRALRDGTVIVDRELREELLTAARVLEYDEKHLDSRGGTVLELTSKSKVKERLGRSPDLLDSAMMAAWAANTENSLNVGVAFG